MKLSSNLSNHLMSEVVGSFVPERFDKTTAELRHEATILFSLANVREAVAEGLERHDLLPEVQRMRDEAQELIDLVTAIDTAREDEQPSCLIAIVIVPNAEGGTAINADQLSELLYRLGKGDDTE